MRKEKEREKKIEFHPYKDTSRALASKVDEKLEGGSWSTNRGSMLIALNFASTSAQAFPLRKV